jgi:3-carboxy-cis,cis-muconate cycloisomerase
MFVHNGNDLMLSASASTVFDSLLFRDTFGTPAMRNVFSDASLIRKYITVEIALAKAQSRLNVIPATAAAEIEGQIKFEQLDFERLKHETENVGYPILPLVTQLAEQCEEAGKYIHWGATTQDIMDTANALQIKEALALVEADIRALRKILQELASTYKDTPMAGRTHLQQALPITFGYKCAIWLGMFDRHEQRLRELKPRVEVGQLAGAAGTLASLGDMGLEVQAEMMRELGLGIPVTTWHVARDNFAEALNFLALVTGSLGKIALDIMLMASTEYAEVYEPFVKGRGASSTMPQKRNPISSEIMLACAKGVRQHAGLMLDAMVQDFERATGPWHAEWIAIPESFLLTASALAQARFALGGLEVDAAQMQKNLGISKGLIVAESVMMALAAYVGKHQAHEVVYDACRKVNSGNQTLADVLMQTPAVTQHLSDEQIQALTNPVNYLGKAPEMVAQALNASARI